MTGGSEPAVVDARGLRCPVPVIMLARAAQHLAPGSTLVVLATDPAARLDIPAWARMRGHTVLSLETTPDDALRVAVEIGPSHQPPEHPATTR